MRSHAVSAQTRSRAGRHLDLQIVGACQSRSCAGISIAAADVAALAPRTGGTGPAAQPVGGPVVFRHARAAALSPGVEPKQVSTGVTTDAVHGLSATTRY